MRLFDFLDHMPTCLWCDPQTPRSCLQTDLHILMIKESQQRQPSREASRTKFNIHRVHLIKKPFELANFIVKECLVLCDADLGEAVDQFVNRHVFELYPFHG